MISNNKYSKLSIPFPRQNTPRFFAIFAGMTASIKPRASRKSLDKLIKYLGKRAKDFKKCFDTSSKWCLKYADLVTREHDPQTMEYAERHHIVPVSYYKAAGFRGHRWHESICSGNIAVLPFGEHLYAHYCAALCARGEMVDKCAHAFWKMYTAQSRGGRKLLPGEREFVKSIPAREAEKVRGMISQVALVEKEGRPHSWDDPVAAVKASQRSYYVKNGDLVRARSKRYREEHPEECRQRGKQWYVDNRDHVREYSKLYREENAGAIKAQRKEYRETHREEIAARKHDDHIRNREKNNARSRKWYREHIGEEHEKARAYRETHKEEIRLRDRAYYANNKEAISERADNSFL